jgi:hypothetical protein
MRLSENHIRTINDLLLQWQNRLIEDPSELNKYNFKVWMEKMMRSFIQYDTEVKSIMQGYPTLLGVLGGSVPSYHKRTQKKSGCCG